ncbi:MAG: TIGR01777 family protein [Planctomycetes bacterium]|nr:TIGR01777 family protein [Planctomycetota bacterium]
MKFRFASGVAQEADSVFAWHAQASAFPRLMPPWEGARLVARSGTLEIGSTVDLAVPVGPSTRAWRARITAVDPGRCFVDEQVVGPFRSWRHTHSFLSVAEGCQIVDEIDCQPPVPALTSGWVGRRIARAFAFRHRRTADDLARHAAWPPRRLRIAISGAGGFLGGELADFLSAGGHEVVRLVRAGGQRPGCLAWDPSAGLADPSALSGFDAVVHLAGRTVGERWSSRVRREIRDSRIGPTRRLCEQLAALPAPPKALVCASAIGIYGDRGESVLDEDASPGAGFLAEVCSDWERACDPARAAGIRVVHARLGVVLGAAGGALAKLVPPVRAGVAGRIGSGRQWLSWIAIDDAVAALHHLVQSPLSGVVNVVAPEPVTNAGLMAALGAVLCRPTVLPLPAIAVRVAFGAMGQETLLASARVVPARLSAAGFTWRHGDLVEALRHQLGR